MGACAPLGLHPSQTHRSLFCPTPPAQYLCPLPPPPAGADPAKTTGGVSPTPPPGEGVEQQPSSSSPISPFPPESGALSLREQISSQEGVGDCANCPGCWGPPTPHPGHPQLQEKTQLKAFGVSAPASALSHTWTPCGPYSAPSVKRRTFLFQNHGFQP